MSKARDLADYVSTGGALADGVISVSEVTDLTATATELNVLDGITATTTELNYMDGVTSAVQTQLDAKGTVSSLSDLSVTATATELNILDGVTADTTELNILDGVTADSTELNILDGATVTTTELNHLDGVTSSIQTQLDNVGGGEVQVWAYVTMSGSTPTLENDVGVSSITDLGVGRFDVAFSTTRSSEYYASSGSGWGGGDFIVNTRPSFNGATTKVAIYFNNDAGTLTDPTLSWSIMVAGGN